MRDYRDAKAMAKAIREELSKDGIELTHARALEIVARQFGVETWNILSAKIGTQGGVGLKPPMPIMRIFDVEKAREFYLGFLGFAVDWEHRFGDDYPLYFQVSRGDLRLHLSEHAGDATPGSNMVVPTTGIEAFHAELAGKQYLYMKPGLEREEWGLEMQVTDPFNNRIRFIERL